MAITIIDQPTAFAKVGQKLMIVATSTNVAQPNFRYVVRVNVSHPDAVNPYEIIIPPNPLGALMYNMTHDVKPFVHVENKNTNNKSYISELTQLTVSTYGQNCQVVADMQILEAYDVLGVFTIDEDSSVVVETPQEVSLFNFVNAKYSVRDGYKPDPNLIYSFTSTTSLLLGGRKVNTHIPKDNPYLTANSQRVFIPVRRNELDWGTLSFVFQTTQDICLTDATLEPSIKMILYEEDGTPNTQSTSSIDYDTGTSEITFLGVYPANLNAHGELLRPADFPNWRWYEIAMYDSTNRRKSAIYTFYPVDVDCLHDNVRLGWWDAENGGFDFFNFSKKNEQTVEVERTRVQKVVGSYNATTFTFDPSDHELAEGDIAVRTYLDINSDYIQEGEFALLKRLITSPLVYIVEDSGTLIPVLVDTNSYTSKKTRDGKLYNVSIRLRYSNELM